MNTWLRSDFATTDFNGQFIAHELGAIELLYDILCLVLR